MAHRISSLRRTNLVAIGGIADMLRADWVGSIRKSDPTSPFHNLSFCESTRQSLSSPADDEIDIAFVFRHRFSFPFMR
jgi:hypothetical protein